MIPNTKKNFPFPEIIIIYFGYKITKLFLFYTRKSEWKKHITIIKTRVLFTKKLYAGPQKT